MIHNSSYKIKNILIVYSASNGTGGGDTHLNHLVLYWKKKNINIKILTLKTFNKFSLLNNIKFAYIPIKVIIGLSNLTQEDILKSDIILSASPYPSDLFHSIKLGKRYNKKVMCYFHHIVPGLLYHPFKRGLFRTVLNVVYSKYALYLVKKNHIAIFLDHPEFLKDSKIYVYENLIPIEEYNADKNNANENKIYDLCYIGRVTKPKGIIDLIKVLKMVNDEGIKSKTAIIGSYNSKMKIKLDKLIHKFGLEGQLTFFGYVNNEQKIEILKRSKIFISLSYEEGWSISVMEAANYGIPIVAYDLAAYNYLHGNYYSAPVGNLFIVRTLIINILNNTELLDKYIKNAMYYVKAYNYADIAEDQLKYMSNFLLKVK